MSKDSLTAFSYASCIFCFAASAAPAAAFTIAFCACWKEFRNFYKREGKSKKLLCLAKLYSIVLQYSLC